MTVDLRVRSWRPIDHSTRSVLAGSTSAARQGAQMEQRPAAGGRGNRHASPDGLVKARVSAHRQPNGHPRKRRLRPRRSHRLPSPPRQRPGGPPALRRGRRGPLECGSNSFAVRVAEEQRVPPVRARLPLEPEAKLREDTNRANVRHIGARQDISKATSR